MRKYELVGHTADMKVQVSADSMKELFLAALEGMNELISPQKSQNPMYFQIEIKLTAQDTVALLIDFLAEILTHTHMQRIIYRKIHFLQLTDTELHATLTGERVDSFIRDVKA